jgi:hypothetical protein
MDQMLTVTHDTAAAGAGIGAALSNIWRRRTAPRSTLGVAFALVYLGNIGILHITTSSLFSIQIFNATRSMSVGTEGLPAVNLTRYIMSSLDDSLTAWSVNLFCSPLRLNFHGTGMIQYLTP